MKKTTVIVLRRSPEELDPSYIDALKACFLGREIEFVRTDPVDFMEHDKDCKRLNPAAVILPFERPIPSLAMERGIAHVVWLSDGSVGRLKTLVPDFEPFKV